MAGEQLTVLIWRIGAIQANVRAPDEEPVRVWYYDSSEIP